MRYLNLQYHQPYLLVLTGAGLGVMGSAGALGTGILVWGLKLMLSILVGVGLGAMGFDWARILAGTRGLKEKS